MLEIISENPEKTKTIGKLIGEVLKPNDVLALYGELGAGKTVLVQGLAEGMGIKEMPSSPSFVIANEYKGDIPLYHIDLYRLEGSDITELGIEEYFEKGGVSVIEWAERAKDHVPEKSIDIEIDIFEVDKRKIIIKGKDIDRLREALVKHKLIKG